MLALPVWIAGVRTSVIINIGTAAIASTVGAKTLGSPIIVGLSGFNTAYVIQGAILVGALLQLGSTNLAVLVMSFIAATIASINIFGGFLVSYRMLGMFKKEA